jgi:ABC-type nitrate/sulfonate/bicarbonate transport system substrate-binding protein
MKKSLIIIIGLILIGIAIAGISGFFGGNNTPEKSSINVQRPVVRIATPDFGTSVIAIIAEKKGFFEQEGITVEKVGVIQSAIIKTVLAKGDIDVMLGFHPDTVIKSRLSGLDFKIIAAGSDATREHPHMSFVVLENSSIKSAKDLKGKKIGEAAILTEACTYYSLSDYLNQDSMTVDDVEQVTMPDTQQWQAMKQGLIEVGAMHAPFSGVAVNAGGRRLFTDYDTMNGAVSLVISTERVIKEKPAALKGFVSAIAKAEDWTNANPDEADKIIAQELALDPETARYMDRRIWVEHGLIDDELIQKWIDEMVKYGNLKEGDIKISDVYTNEFNPYK